MTGTFCFYIVKLYYTGGKSTSVFLSTQWEAGKVWEGRGRGMRFPDFPTFSITGTSWSHYILDTGRWINLVALLTFQGTQQSRKTKAAVLWSISGNDCLQIIIQFSTPQLSRSEKRPPTPTAERNLIQGKFPFVKNNDSTNCSDCQALLRNFLFFLVL